MKKCDACGCVKTWDGTCFPTELGGLDPASDMRREIVALLFELRAARGPGIGIVIQPLRWAPLSLDESGALFPDAVQQSGAERFLLSPDGKGLSVHPSVVGERGELVGTTCQAAR